MRRPGIFRVFCVERLQRDVLVPAAAGGRLGQRLGQLAAGVGGVDLLVHHADLDGGVHAAGDAFVFGGELLVQRLAVLGAAAASFFLCRMPTAALAPMTATSASGQAKTFVAPSDREFIAM